MIFPPTVITTFHVFVHHPFPLLILVIWESWFILFTVILTFHCSVSGKVFSTGEPHICTITEMGNYSFLSFLLLINIQEVVSVSSEARAGGSVVPQGPEKWNLKKKIWDLNCFSINYTRSIYFINLNYLWSCCSSTYYNCILAIISKLQSKNQAIFGERRLIPYANIGSL